MQGQPNEGGMEGGSADKQQQNQKGQLLAEIS